MASITLATTTPTPVPARGRASCRSSRTSSSAMATTRSTFRWPRRKPGKSRLGSPDPDRVSVPSRESSRPARSDLRGPAGHPRAAEGPRRGRPGDGDRPYARSPGSHLEAGRRLEPVRAEERAEIVRHHGRGPGSAAESHPGRVPGPPIPAGTRPEEHRPRQLEIPRSTLASRPTAEPIARNRRSPPAEPPRRTSGVSPEFPGPGPPRAATQPGVTSANEPRRQITLGDARGPSGAEAQGGRARPGPAPELRREMTATLRRVHSRRPSSLEACPKDGPRSGPYT